MVKRSSQCRPGKRKEKEGGNSIVWPHPEESLSDPVLLIRFTAGQPKQTRKAQQVAGAVRTRPITDVINDTSSSHSRRLQIASENDF